jgi:DNA repair exonuclease SbcCD ATPase subunit
MSKVDETHRRARVAVRNVGGIDHTEVTFDPGVTVLAGRNATNRTSLLRAMMAALGSDDVSLKGDADEGRVELTVDGDTYTRTLQRTSAGVTTGGDPYLEDATTADLFAFLLETNEARQAVVRGDDLADLVMRPVDTDELRSDIRRLDDEKRDLDRTIDNLERQVEELPALRDEREALETDVEETRAELADLESEIDDHGGTVDAEVVEGESELEARLAELRAARNELEELRYDIETEERSIAALREERDELEADREAYPDSFEEREDLQTEIDRLRGRTSEIAETVRELGTVVQFNEERLADGDAPLAAALEEEDGAGGGSADHGDGVTDALVEDGTVCWTCGSDVEASQIESTLERLRAFRSEQRERKQDLEDRIDDLETELAEQAERRRQRDQIDDRLAEIDEEIQRREATLEDLRAQRGAEADRVEDLEAAVDDLETDEHQELLELHEAANEQEFELGRLQTRLDDLEAEIERVEARREELAECRERRETVADRLQELRTRIRSLQEDAVEAFNEHMAALLARLSYDNIERIWIERVAEGDLGSDEASFELHVVRSTAEGVTYEDAVAHLSESEREVTGLVVALAGYLVHDVAETVPFMLLDSLEAIDAERIATLVEYLEAYAPFLVVALLPEDAAALDDGYDRVTEV